MVKINKKNLLKYLIDEMLKPYNSSYNKVIEEPIIEGKDWYSFYEYKTKEDFYKFKEFFITTLTKNTVPKYNKKSAENEWVWFNLMFGLKENFNDNK